MLLWSPDRYIMTSIYLINGITEMERGDIIREKKIYLKQFPVILVTILFINRCVTI